MKDYMYLRFLDRYKKQFHKFGVSYEMVREILAVKITMDARRQTTMTNNVKKESKSFFTRSLLTHGLMGAMLSFFLIPNFDIFFQMNIVIGIILFMLMTSLIADFSSVLLDQRDKIILMTKPVETKVVSLVKTLHIIYYVGILLFIMSIIPLIVGTIKFGLMFSLLFIVSIGLTLLFAMFFTTLLYFLILKFFDGEKLKDIINYFQIILTVGMIFGYQLMSRMYTVIDFDMVFQPKWWNFLVPSAWFASYFKIFIEGSSSATFIALGIVGILVPIVAIIIHTRFVMPYFEGYLNKMNQVGGASKKVGTSKRLKAFLLKVLCPDKEERAFIQLYFSLMKHERKLKLRIIPQLVMAMGFPFLMMFNTGFKLEAGSRLFLMAYISLWLFSYLFITYTFSDTPKGSWIYKSLPISNSAVYFRALYKAVMVKYLIPVLLVVLVVFSILFKFQIVPHLILIFVNTLLGTLLVFKLTVKDAPFSCELDVKKGGNIAFVFGTIVVGIIAASHLVMSFIPKTVYINIVVSVVLFIACWHILYRRQSK